MIQYYLLLPQQYCILKKTLNMVRRLGLTDYTCVCIKEILPNLKINYGYKEYDISMT